MSNPSPHFSDQKLLFYRKKYVLNEKTGHSLLSSATGSSLLYEFIFDIRLIFPAVNFRVALP